MIIKTLLIKSMCFQKNKARKKRLWGIWIWKCFWMQRVPFHWHSCFQNLCGPSRTSFLSFFYAIFSIKHNKIQSDRSLFSADWQADCRFNSQLQLWQHASFPLKVFPHLVTSPFTSVSITTSSEREMEILKETARLNLDQRGNAKSIICKLALCKIHSAQLLHSRWQRTGRIVLLLVILVCIL